MRISGFAFLTSAVVSIWMAGTASVVQEIEQYVTPPQISDEEILSDAGSITELGYKIHGKNGGDDKFKCKSFESQLSSEAQQQAVLHGVLSSYAYLDDAPGYTYVSDGVTKIQDRQNCLENTGYEALSAADLATIAQNTSLKVTGDGKRLISQSETEAQNTRFDAVVLTKKDADGKVTEVVVSYRGTEVKNLKDWQDDLKQALNHDGEEGLPKQYTQASELLRAVLNNPAYKDAKIVCDGHSLGGGLVTYAMADNDLQGRVTGYTYNAAGLSESTLNSIGNVEQIKEAARNITNVRAQWDPVSYVGYHLGEMYETSSPIKDATKNHGMIYLLDSMMPYGVNPKETATTTTDGSTPRAQTTTTSQTQANSSVATTQDDFVDMGASSGGDSGMSALAEQMLKEYLSGESQVLPADFLSDAYGTLSSEVRDAQTIAQDAYGAAIDALVTDSALAQAIKDYAALGGDDQSSLSDLLDGALTDDQKSQVLSLTDALKAVEQDGGKSLVAALGDKGQSLADSLAVNEIKKQLQSSLPKDQAETLNAALGVLETGGLSAETKQALVDAAQSLVTKTLPANSADSVNKLLQDISDGKSVSVLDTAKDLGKSISADTLKSVFSENLDPALADKLNALLDGYMQNGAQGLSETALKELDALIDQYAPGANTAQKLKDAVKDLVSGKASPSSWKDLATTVVADTANKLIDGSNLPQSVKDAAKSAVTGLTANGLTGLTSNVRDFISDFVSDALGSEEAGEAVGKIFDAIVTPGVDPWQEIVKQAPTIGTALAEKFLDEAKKLAADQLDKLIAKFPVVKKILDKLGINGTGIVQGFINVLGVLLTAPDISSAINTLSKMAVNFLKEIAKKLIDWAVEWAVQWVTNTLIPKVMTWASETLGKWADSVDNALIKKGLLWLQQQCENCKKQGAIKIKTAGTGEKVVNYIEKLIQKRKQPQNGTTVLKK